MPSSVGDINIYKVSIGDLYSISKISVGEKVVYSAGNVVTYHVDSGTSYQEEIDEGDSCLAPKTFTPSKSGWEFVGWREDTAANGSILAGKVMEDNPVNLYAVFRQTVTVTYYNNSTSESKTSGYRYYNNGAVTNPSFTLSQATRSGWTARGWSTGTAGNGEITYANGAAFTRDSNIILYGMYQQTITLDYYNGTTTKASTSGTRYYNPGSGGVVNPTFSLTPAALSGWTFRGWATSSAAVAGIAYNSISNMAFAASTTVYACYYQTITLSYGGNGATGGSTAAQTGTRYYNTGNYSNPSFTLSANGFTRSNATFYRWALGSLDGTQYATGDVVTLSASTTMYAKWHVTESHSQTAPCSIARPYKDQGDWTGSVTITTQTVSGAFISGTLISDSDGDEEWRCDATLFVNNSEIASQYSQDGVLQKPVSVNLGASNGIVVKLLVHPNSTDEGTGSFSGTVTYTMTSTVLV